MQKAKRTKTKDELMTSAKNILIQDGHEVLTVRKLSEVTGFSHTSLYYYFSDLQHLLWELRISMIEDMIQELSLPTSSTTDPVSEIIEAFTRYADYFIEHPTVFRFFYFHAFQEPENDNRFRQLEQRFQGMWHSSFTRLILDGVIELENLETVATSMIYMVQGLLLLSFQSIKTQLDIHREITNCFRYLLESQLKKGEIHEKS